MIGAMTSRPRTRFRCGDCGQTAAVWNGRCSGCNGWNTLVEEPVRARGHTLGAARGHAPGRDARGHGTGPGPLAELSALRAHPVSVGVAEVDRVLAGGLVPGSVTLLSGPPGVGKSTLALQIASGLASVEGTAPVVYVAAEETVAQIRLRADRLGLAVPPTLLVTDDPSVADLVGVIDEQQPAAVIVDSVQAIVDEDLGATPGSVTQVRGGAQRLANAARAAGSSLVLIGHVTKDGAIAGPRTLEHLVDTVITFDADLDEGLRMLRAIKHRFGPVGELGVFTMGHDGLRGMHEVTGLFLEDRRADAPGSVVCPVRDGRRTLLAEIQALVRPRDGSRGDRHAQGLDAKRVDLVLAVLEAATGVGGDTFVSVTGGLRVAEPGADLAVAVAVHSAALGVPVAPGVVVCGEVGLTGEVRRVAAIAERIADAAALGFTRAVVPAGTPSAAGGLGIELVRVADVAAASRAALLAAPIGGDAGAQALHELHSVRG
jgi:DNA repair protein RadA/Sms